MEEQKNKSSQNAEVSAATQSPPLQKKSRFPFPHTFIAIGLILLVLFVIGYASYYFFLDSQLSNIFRSNPSPTPSITISPSPDPTVNWKTYTNSTYNFSFKYPSQYTIDNTIIKSFDEYARFFEGRRHKLAVLVQPNTNNLSLNEFIQTTNLIDSKIKQPIHVGNQNGLLLVNEMLCLQNGSTCPEGEVEFTLTNVVFSKENFIVSIQTNSYLDEGDQAPMKDKELLLQILSTFKFLSVMSYNSSETNGFPEYPGAVLTKKEKLVPCGEAYSGYAICGSVAYHWYSTDNFDQVTEWYRTDPLKTGWTCSGGAGQYASPNDASGKTFCRNGSLYYTLHLFTDQNGTEIILALPENQTLTSPTPKAIICTQDAKLCPDGSYVGRVGPNCEFAPCP